MPQIPFHLRYSLSRGHRLVPHLCLWGGLSLLIPVGLAAIVILAIRISPWWGLLVVPLLFVFRGFFVGLLDVALHPTCDMDIIVEKDALGCLVGGQRWYLFLDGIIAIN